MTKVEKLERDIRSLSAKELATFREWFAAFDAALWDQQLEADAGRSEEHTSELQSRPHLVCRLLLEKKKKHVQHSRPPCLSSLKEAWLARFPSPQDNLA